MVPLLSMPFKSFDDGKIKELTKVKIYCTEPNWTVLLGGNFSYTMTDVFESFKTLWLQPWCNLLKDITSQRIQSQKWRNANTDYVLGIRFRLHYSQSLKIFRHFAIYDLLSCNWELIEITHDGWQEVTHNTVIHQEKPPHLSCLHTTSDNGNTQSSIGHEGRKANDSMGEFQSGHPTNTNAMVCAKTQAKIIFSETLEWCMLAAWIIGLFHKVTCLILFMF